MPEFDIGKAICPVCGNDVGLATPAPGTSGPPEPGSVAICANCKVGLIFKSDLTLRTIEIQDILAMPVETVIRLGKAAVRIGKTTLH